MKRLKVMLGILIFANIWMDMYAQGLADQLILETIRPRPIRVTFSKTTNLIFPATIEDVDYGSNGIIVQQRKGAKNILHVKAARKDFGQTSLSIVTKDGSFYSFVVGYADDAEDINFVCSREPGGLAHVVHNETEMENCAAAVEQSKPFMNKIRNGDFSRLNLQGIYLCGETLWMDIKLSNYSFVDFPIGYLKFFLKDKKRIRRQAVQEREVFPVYSKTPEAVAGKSAEGFVVGFDLFTIPKRQVLVVQIGEKVGGRMLELKIRPRSLLKARNI